MTADSDDLPGALAAIFADTVDLKIMPGGVKAIFAPDLFLDLGDFRREELDRGAAIRADHMMMAATIELVFEASGSVRKWDHARQPAFGQQL